jgi:hypothetical protein
MKTAGRVGLFVSLAFLFEWSAQAGFTETAPQGTFIVDESISMSTLKYRYDNDFRKTTLIDPVERYEIGGGLQGVLTPEAEVRFLVLINQIQYGILDNLTVAVGIPVVLYTDINLDLQWEEGDYQPGLGRSYSEQDFWDWAGGMGQPKPDNWRGNKGVLSDIIVGLRYRFSDDIAWLDKQGLAVAVMIMGALPTGRQAEPEEIASAGTTMWDLHSQGELCFHLSLDKRFDKYLDGRVTVGLDVFYEFLFKHEYVTPQGTKNPLMLTYAPYVGKNYTLDPGDFSGVAFQVDVIAWRGPALATWISGGDQARAEKLPPLLSLSFRYTFTHLGQSDWESESAIWDWEREKLWLPGHKNTLLAKVAVSLLRVGVPLQLYFAYRNQSWLAGQNSRAADVFSGGLVIPAKFW